MIYLLAIFLLNGEQVAATPAEPWTLNVSMQVQQEEYPRWVRAPMGSQEECSEALFLIITSEPVEGVRFVEAFCDRPPQYV